MFLKYWEKQNKTKPTIIQYYASGKEWGRLRGKGGYHRISQEMKPITLQNFIFLLVPNEIVVDSFFKHWYEYNHIESMSL